MLLFVTENYEMEKTITIAREHEHELGKIVVLGKKFLGHCKMKRNPDFITLHWTFKAPQYLDLFLKKIPADVVQKN